MNTLLRTLSTSAVLLLASPAWAQSIASQEKTIAGGTITIVAYIALWVLIFGTVFAILRHQRALQNDLDQLRRRMDEVLDISDQQ